MSMAQPIMPVAVDVDTFPVKTETGVTAKSGISIVLHSYSNRYFVIVSEAGSQSVGTVIQVVKHQQTNGFEVGPASTIYDINIKFGPETPELLLAARVLASKVDFDKPVLFGLALKKFDKEVFQEVTEELTKILSKVSKVCH